MKATRDTFIYGVPARILNHPANDYVFKGCAEESWKPEMYRFLRDLLSPGMCVLDIGAYVGSITLYCAAHGCPVGAFEPDPRAFAVLQGNLSANQTYAAYVDAYDIAVSDKRGSATISSRGAWGRSVSRLAADELPCDICGRYLNDRTQIRTVTLSDAWQMAAEAFVKMPDFARKPIVPGLVKINVQGYEVAILEEAAPWLVEHKPTVHLYIRPKNWPESVTADSLARALRIFPRVRNEAGLVELKPEAVTQSPLAERPDYKLVCDWGNR